MFGEDSFFGRHKIFTGVLTVLLLLLIIGGFWLRSRMIGRHHDYELDFLIPAAEAAVTPGQIEVGVAKRSIAPDFSKYDEWVDVNGNSKYDEGVDTYTDRNGNGKFDGIWIAGFGTNRPATGMNDDPWVRAIALRNNGVTFVMVTLDSVGIFHNDFVDIRKSLDESLDIDHVMFSSTHVHETPDTMKIWSYAFRFRGLDVPVFGYAEHYMDLIQVEAKDAIEEAVGRLAPADMYCAQVEIEPEGFVNDSRDPKIMDDTMYLMRFTKPDRDDTIATVVSWGNHPETLGGKNTLITSDFPHWLREGVENGVPEPNGVEGLGGMCLYFQGMVGGLMTQLHTTVPHRDGKRKFKEDTFEKAESLGYNLAIVACNALRSPDLVWKNEAPEIHIAAKTFRAPVQGVFKYAMMLGLIHEGYYLGGTSKSELNVIRIGDVVMTAIPGEIYPEIVEGGVEAKPGRDFDIPPVEVPPLRTVMEGKARMAFIVGLANDQIGYIIPKSQWDVEPPFVYRDKSQYGEVNSGGPDVAPTIHAGAMELLNRVNGTF